jgi:DNA replicative helicase MCM subunit Mcm2 (Cdc46/Mcm family)
MFDAKHGLASLNHDIIVELVVKKCPYYKRSKKKELTIITGTGTRIEKLSVVLDVILQLEKEQGLAPKGEVMQRLQTKGIKPEQADELIRYLLREGIIYEAKDGYLKKT